MECEWSGTRADGAEKSDGRNAAMSGITVIGFNEEGALKMLDVKMTDVKLTDQMTGHENVGHEIAGHKRAGYETDSGAANI